jgi:hypothetical protein
VTVPSPAVVHDSGTRAWPRPGGPATPAVIRPWSLGGHQWLLLQRSGNAVEPEQQDELQQLGTVGDVCFRFFDQDGHLIGSPFNDPLARTDTANDSPSRARSSFIPDIDLRAAG